MPVLLERHDAVAILSLSRPDQRNAWGADFEVELAAHLTALAADDSVRCVVLTGDPAGKAFSAGANLKDGKTHEPREPRVFVESLTRLKDWIGNRIVEVPKPTIAAVNGYAIGAGTLMSLCCDLVIASDRAEWRMPQASLGITASYGCYARMLRRVGKGDVMRAAFGFPIPAAEALRIGLAQWLVPHDDLRARTLEIAGHIAGLAPLAARLIKESVNRSAEIGNIGEAAVVDLYRLMVLEQTQDSHEAHEAWRERRPANFTGQ